MAGTKGKSGMSENSLKNLTPINEHVTPEEARENGRKGGIASGQARREKRDMQKRITEILSMTIMAGKEGNFTNLAESNGQNLSVMDACILKQVQSALKGNTRALEFLRDTADMKPAEKQEVTTDIKNAGHLAEILHALKEE